MKYYENKEEHGIIIDWKEVFKEFRKLKVPKDFYNPCTLPMENVALNILLSERSDGKTTQCLLIGLILNKLYGTVTQYIRQTQDMVAPKNCNNIFATIVSYNNGQYIKHITNDKYNNIYILWHKAYYCYIDEEGKRLETAPDPFLQFLSIDNNFNYKSSYNAPLGDWIIFDEFQGKFIRPNEFIDFMDLLKTIIRSRKTPRIIMLSNTIDYNSLYFVELEIHKEIKKLHKGQSAIFKTDKGTNIYVEIIATRQNAIKSEINKMFFGFNNSKLSAITGEGSVWAFECVPHIWHNDDDELICKNIFVDCVTAHLQIELWRTIDRGYIADIHECNLNKIKDSDIILTNNDITKRNQLYGVGRGSLCRIIWQLYKENKFYYADNSVGSILKNYIQIYKNNKYL